MLTIHINKGDANGLVSYFTSSLSKDDYFFSSKATIGRWYGGLAKELGLPEKVSKQAFSRLAHNRHPVTNEKLTVRDSKMRRSSIEFCFSAPKSVSLVMALSKKEERRAIIHAHRRAVKKAMRAIEQDIQTQTRINGRKRYVETGNIVYGLFTHFTARPTALEDHELARYASDPQLHSHCVAMNCTSYKGKLQAIEASTVYRMAPYYQNLYHSYLSKGLADLGYTIKREKERWEIKSPGMTRRTIEKMSRRMMEVEKLAKKLGVTNPKTKSELAARSRVNKNKVRENSDLIKIWKARLSPLEYDAIVHAKTRRSKTDKVISPEQAIERSIHHHLERQSTAPTKRILAYALSLGYGHFTPKQIQNVLDKREDILYARRGYLEYLTTKQMVHFEDKMIEFAARGKGRCIPLYPNYKVTREFLNQDQRRAIDKILTSTDRVSILQGAAGVGKSTLLEEIREAVEKRGKRIMAVALTSGASRDVLRSKGFKNSETIAKFLNAPTLQKQIRNNILLVDEASFIGVGTANKLFDVARKYNARVILSGDARQHNAPEYGDALKILEDKAGIEVIKIDKILRQRKNPAYKNAIDLLAKGQSRMAFKALKDMGAIEEVKETKKRHKQLAKEYIDALEQKQTCLVISPTHAEGKLLTDTIRSEMKSRGRIKRGEKQYTIQRNLSLTDAQKQDLAQYEKGQVIQFHQNVKGGLRAGVKYEVVSRSPLSGIKIQSTKDQKSFDLPLHVYERFQVYERGKINIAIGDSIRITQNGKTKEGSRLSNGQVLHIKGFTTQGDIKLSNGKTLDQTYANFTYGLVQTSHASQGKDAKNVFIAMGAMSFPAINKKAFYVSASRGAERIRLFTDDTKGLMDAVDRQGEQMSAHDVADHQLGKDKRMRYRKIKRRRMQRFYLGTFSKTVDHERSKDHTKEIVKTDVFEPSRDS